MAGRSTTTLWNDVLTLGLQWFDRSGKIADNIINGLVLLWYMSGANAIRRIPGGSSIIQQVFYGKSTATGSYRGRDVLNTDAQDGYTTVEYNWKQHYATVNLSGIELATADGPEAIMNLADARFEQCLASAKDDLNSQLMGDGSGNNYKDFTGLKALVPENGQGAYGDIDSAVAANSWWRPQVQTVGSAAANLRKKLDQIFVDTVRSRSDGKPHLIIGTSGFYLKAEDALRSSGERYLVERNPKAVDLGLAPLYYKGIPIEYDFALPKDSDDNDQAYVLNFRYFKFMVHRGTFFRAGRFIEGEDQDAFVAKILSYGEACTNNRRHMGLLKGVTA